MYMVLTTFLSANTIAQNQRMPKETSKAKYTMNISLPAKCIRSFHELLFDPDGPKYSNEYGSHGNDDHPQNTEPAQCLMVIKCREE